MMVRRPSHGPLRDRTKIHGEGYARVEPVKLLLTIPRQCFCCGFSIKVIVCRLFIRLLFFVRGHLLGRNDSLVICLS